MKANGIFSKPNQAEITKGKAIMKAQAEAQAERTQSQTPVSFGGLQVSLQELIARNSKRYS